MRSLLDAAAQPLPGKRVEDARKRAGAGERLGRGDHVMWLNLTGTGSKDFREAYRPCPRFAGCNWPEGRLPSRLISRIILSSFVR